MYTGIRITNDIFFPSYFATPYPLPKLDMIAIPDFSAGAMENYGLVTYRDTALLYDELLSSASNKQQVIDMFKSNPFISLANNWWLLPILLCYNYKQVYLLFSPWYLLYLGSNNCCTWVGAPMVWQSCNHGMVDSLVAKWGFCFLGNQSFHHFWAIYSLFLCNANSFL